MALTAAQYAANLASADILARQNAGLPSKSELPDASLTYDQRTAYNKAMAAIIQKYPDSFSDTSASAAALTASTNYQPLDNYTVLDAAEDFTSEAAAQAGRIATTINDTLNPLSAANLQTATSTVKWIAILGGVGIAAYFIVPPILAAKRAVRRVTPA